MKQSEQDQWRSGTWAGAEQACRAADRRLSLWQKLEWNAAALKLAAELKRKSQLQSQTRARGYIQLIHRSKSMFIRVHPWLKPHADLSHNL